MTTKEFFTDFISPTSHKIKHDQEEFHEIKNYPGVVLVKATTLYQIYKHNVFCKDEKRLTMQEFFRVSGQYLYYDKYICKHGTEFYYYVIFNKSNKMFEITKDVILKRVYVNRPQLLRDLEFVVEAVTKEY